MVWLFCGYFVVNFWLINWTFKHYSRTAWTNFSCSAISMCLKIKQYKTTVHRVQILQNDNKYNLGCLQMRVIEHTGWISWIWVKLFQRSVCKGLVFGGELQCNSDWNSDLKCLARCQLDTKMLIRVRENNYMIVISRYKDLGLLPFPAAPPSTAL